MGRIRRYKTGAEKEAVDLATISVKAGWVPVALIPRKSSDRFGISRPSTVTFEYLPLKKSQYTITFIKELEHGAEWNPELSIRTDGTAIHHRYCWLAHNTICCGDFVRIVRGNDKIGKQAHPCHYYVTTEYPVWSWDFHVIVSDSSVGLAGDIEADKLYPAEIILNGNDEIVELTVGKFDEPHPCVPF